jgi:hypothetical protein
VKQRLGRKVGPAPLWVWLIVGGIAGVYLYRRFRAQQQTQGDLTPQFGLQPIGGLGSSIVPAPITPVDAMSATVVSTPIANGVGSQSLAGSSTFKVPTLSFASVGTGTGGGGGSDGGLEQPFAVQGYSADQVAAAAARYAAGKSYGGVPYQPHKLQQEGTITYHGNVAGVMVKYSTPGYGDTTEWTPLG